MTYCGTLADDIGGTLRIMMLTSVGTVYGTLWMIMLT